MNDYTLPAVPVLALAPGDLAKLEVDALVVGVRATTDGPRIDAELPRTIVDHLTAVAPALGISGKLDDVVRVPAPDGLAARVLVVTGLGDAESIDEETVRRAAGAALRTTTGAETVGVALPATTTDHVVAAAEGASLGAYAFTRYTTPPTSSVARIVVAVPHGVDAPPSSALDRAAALARSVHLVRDLVNTPPNDLFPAAFAAVAKDVAKLPGVKVTVLDDKALAAGGYGGLTAVGKGSVRGPRLVKVAYAPARGAGKAPKVALVGKGITFDSGGLSLKTAGGMETMKSDMGGAATVLATVIAAARLKLQVAVTGWLCLAENMPSGTAQRPGDVITIRGGTTVEVLNTDAEGRLVLADGLVAAAEESPHVMLDVATLTGAQVVALGNRVGGVMGASDVRAEVCGAAEAAGEQFWPMPLPAELREGLRSKVADLANVGERAGGMLTAGLFLREFVGSTPWAHLDIAGPAYNGAAAFGYTPTGGTGVAVRTLLTFLETRAGR